MRHLMSPLDFSTEELEELMDLADDIRLHPEKYAKSCEGKKLATCFYEPSTRTRLSFEAAMLNLGGSVLGFSSADSSSAAKGESVSDTIRVISGYADICAMRHPKEGAPPGGFPALRDFGHQRRRRRASTSHSDSDGSLYHPIPEGKDSGSYHRTLRRSEIRADRPLPDQRPGTLPQHPLRPDLPRRSCGFPTISGRTFWIQPRPLRGSGKLEDAMADLDILYMTPCSEGAVLQTKRTICA